MTNHLRIAILGLIFFARFAVAAERWSKVVDVQAVFPMESVRFLESFADSPLQVDGYSAGSSYLFAVRGDGVQPFAYRLSPVRPTEPTRWQVIAHEPIPLRVNAGERRIAVFDERDSPRTNADARRLLVRLLTARDEWQSAQRELSTANGRDSEQAHAAWGRIAQSLESAVGKYPEHLGILADLIAAYTQLLAFERNTDRGHAICRLLPLCLRDFERRAGTLSVQETDMLRRSRALWYFLTERYPLAQQMLATLNGSADAQTMASSLAALHQDRFEDGPKINIEVSKFRYEVVVVSTTRPSPEPRIQHHLRYFFPKPAGASDGHTWFTLTTQQLTDTPRYYLYGWEGNRAKVLRFYGKTRPTADELAAEVRRLVSAALATPRSETGAP